MTRVANEKYLVKWHKIINNYVDIESTRLNDWVDVSETISAGNEFQLFTVLGK